MVPGPRRPILLFGFDWDTQMKQDFTATIWGVVFLRKTYTDEADDAYQHASPEKQQEVKYGNNITALFMALLHFAAYRERPGFWEAIAQGFSFNKDIIRKTVGILTAARRIGQRRPGKHRSQLLNLADEWIEIIDGHSDPRTPSVSSSSEQLKPMARQFYKGVEERPLLNAARIPYDNHAWHSAAVEYSSHHASNSRRTSGMADVDRGTSDGRDTPSTGSIQGIDPSRSSRHDDSPNAGGSLASRVTRKRSFSPARGIAAEPENKRRQLDAPGQFSDAQSIVKAAPPSPPAQPSSPALQQTEPRNQAPKNLLATTNGDQSRAEATGASYRVTPLLESIGIPQTAPSELLVETNNLLKNLVSQMEGKATETGQISGKNSTSHQHDENDIETVKDDVNILLQTMQTFTETHSSLIDAVAELREKLIKPDSRPKDSVTVQTSNPGIDGLLEQQKTYFEGLLKEQNEQFKSMARDLMHDAENAMLGSVENSVRHSIEKNLEQPFAQLKAHVTAQVTTALEKPEPRTWGLELAALEDDLKRHLYRIDKFYHKKLDAQSVSSGLANYMADLMVALRDVITRAQAGQNASG